MKFSPIQTYAIALLVVVLGILTLGDILNVVSPDTTFINVLIVTGVTIGIGLSGFKQVTVVHEAVLTVLGTRTPIILTEGWVWIFPWIMDLIEVNVQERSIVIGDDGGLQVIAVDSELTKKELEGGSKRMPTNRGVELTVKMLIRYKIDDVARFLNLEDGILEKNMVEASKSALREYVGRFDYLSIITSKDEAQSCISNAFFAEVGPLAERWGIEIFGLSLAKVVPKNATIISALEKAAVEEKEGEGEQKEMDNVIKQVKRLAKELKVPIKAARQIYQSERNKAKVIIYEGLEGSGARVQIEAPAQE